MKITGFNPIIFTTKPEAAIELFEALGFEQHHHKHGVNEDDKGLVETRMKNADGRYVDVVSINPDKPDVTAIRMNVDNFDEAYAFLTAHGFKNTRGDKVTDTGSSRATMLVSPSGFAINLSQHIKSED